MDSTPSGRLSPDNRPLAGGKDDAMVYDASSMVGVYRSGNRVDR